MWESRELRVVWEPDHRYGDIDFDADGSWATFFSPSGQELGRLFTDHAECLGYMSFGDPSFEAQVRDLIQVAADMKYPAGTAYNSVLGIMLDDSSVTADRAAGPMRRILDHPRD